MAKNNNDSKKKGKEPVFIVKPLVKGYGLDYLHLTLIVLIVILVGLAFALSLSKPAIVQNCSASATNQSCTTPMHNATQVLQAAEHQLAYYKGINSSLSLLSYYALVNESKVEYIPGQSAWLVDIPYLNPYNTTEVLNFSLVVNDSSLSVENAYISSLKPASIPDESVVGLGAVALDNTAACAIAKPIPVYLITDPYAPGAIASLESALNASQKYGDEIKTSYYFVFSGYSIAKYKGFGATQTQELGSYMSCASRQTNFRQFLSNLSIAYSGNPLSDSILSQVALGSSLNGTQLSTCLANSTAQLNYESDLASSYNITSTPQFIVNCRYLTLPQTLNYAINYSISELK